MSPSRLVVACVAGLLLAPSLGSAHPMGNFSVNHHSSLRIGVETVELRHILDMAEIPTFQEIQETGIVPAIGHPSVSAYLARKAETLREGLRLELDGLRVDLRIVSSEVIFPPGAGGLPTMKLLFLYRAVAAESLRDGVHQIRFRDDNMPDRAGWKEVIAVPATGVVFTQSSVPDRDRSAALSDYPTDLSSSPPQELEARVFFRHTSSPTAGSRGALALPREIPAPAPDVETVRLQPNRKPTPRNGLTEMITTGETGPALIMLAAVVAMGLGALHALEPGHGKTVVAAYLVGSRGTVRHAILLGLTVTIAHTAGVYLLGGLTLYASRHFVPERVYPWLAIISGLMIAGLGVALFRQRYRAGGHAHADGHTHAHLPARFHEHDHEHDFDWPRAQAHIAQSHIPGHASKAHVHLSVSRVRLRDLIALGVSGGIVPCPAALVVLLSAFSMRRTGFGLFLIVAFSVGLAAVLIVIGVLIVRARHLMSRFKADGVLARRWLPLISAVVVTLLGLSIALPPLTREIPWLWL